MDLQDAKNLALSLIEKNSLTGWLFKFDSGKRRFGFCQPNKKTITLSRQLVALNDEVEVTRTILHEVAHAMAPRDGHGKKWAAACVQLGIAPARCYDSAEAGRNVVIVEPKFYYGCANCGLKIGRFKRSRRGVSCSACCQKYNGGKYTDKYPLAEVL